MSHADQQTTVATLGDEQVRARMQQPLEIAEPRLGRHVLVAHPDEIRSTQHRGGPRSTPADQRARRELAEEPLPRDGHVCVGRHDRGPRVGDLACHRHERPSGGGTPRVRQARDGERHAGLDAGLDPAGLGLAVVVDRALIERDQHDVDTGGAERVELVRVVRDRVDADHRRGPQPEPRRRQCGVHHATAHPPAAGVVRSDVTAPRPDVDDLDVRGGHGTSGRILPARTTNHGAADVFFYELHEGDDEVYSDVLVVSESEWEPDEFFELVQRIRRDIQDGYEHDTLIEAIAVVLERDHGFVFVSDDQLVAAVNVSTEEADNFLADLDAEVRRR